jgi:uncharacterized Zn-binding protein involved in type VI secretion
MRAKQRALSLDEVEDSLESYQRHVHPHKDSKKAGGSVAPEITLSAVAAAPKGACWRCGKSGHQKKDCRQGSVSGKVKVGSGENDKSGNTCERCGKIGHFTTNCWRDRKNAEKRPAWLKEKLKNGQEVSVVNASTFEVLCCSICDGDLGQADVKTQHHLLPMMLSFMR